jgi:hypothetical protein
VSASFAIHLHSKDLAILNLIKNFYGVGKVHIAKDGKSVSFTVNKLNDIVKVIIPHFFKYPLRSNKYVDFKL